MAKRAISRLLPSVETSAFLICDVQERFRTLIHNMNTVIHKTELINQVCHTLSVPCFVSEQNPRALGATVPEITRFPETVIFEKTKFSMYTDELPYQLASKQQVIIVGLEAHVCVFQSVLEMLADDKDVFVICDAASSQRPHDRAVALRNLQEAGAILTTTESVIFALMRDAKHPKFREISGMVKQHNFSIVNEFANQLDV